MRGYLAAWATGLVLLGSGVARAQEAAPALAGPDADAPAELPRTIEAELPPASADPGPSLAIPGGGPSSTPSPSTFAPPPLVGPADAVEGPPRPAPGPGISPAPRTLGLESVSPGSLADPGRGPAPGRINEDDPSRRPRLFGRRAPLRGRVPGRDDDRIAIEPPSNPAADAALKRRIEQQVRSAAGSRLRYFDVRVVDRDVVIRGKVTRFWYRRGVKRAIEGLPTLSGYKTTVVIED